MSKSATGGELSAAGPRTSGEAAPPVSAEDRRRMVAEAAYYRAAARGFQGGDPLKDWVAAEAEISRMLQRKEERAAYERLRADVQKGLAALRGSVTAQSIQDTLERAANRLKKAGEYAAGAINKAAESLKKDIARTPVAMGPGWETFSTKTTGLFTVWRDRSSAFLARAAIGAGDWLNQTGRRLERAPYHAGEMASGDFECVQCGEVVHLQAAEHVPACPKCRHAEFRRVRSR